MFRTLLSLTAAVVFTASPDALLAQSAKDVVGIWTLVSNDSVRPDGSRVQPFGAKPHGLLIFDAGGRYSLQLCNSERTKFKSNNRLEGTPEEYKEAVYACNPHWGRYVVNDADRAIVFNIEGATFANWQGLQQKRSYAVSGDQLKYTVPAASGGGVSEVVWRRDK
jgi:hypothetical protein